MSAGTNFWIRWRVRAGYPVALVYLALSRPRPLLIVIGGVIGIAGLVIRAWAAGHLRKHQTLANGGPYAFTRNPLYFGSVILAAGFIVAGGSIWAGIVVAAYLAVFYPVVMRREERELSAKYGEDFARYAAAVPLFWPRLRPIAANGAGNEKFSGELYRRNREYQAAVGFIVGIAILWARMRWLP
ncbi:MAG TPA: isoprenylcysteine carboxylmethyltransferase family protein [Candidatus Acidoferrales bacterium]|nr:isoprenylcysteine carboxylmethyltransferase family protein [Candidatus Acidoferrales bacterium]